MVRLLILASALGCFLCIAKSLAGGSDVPIISRAAFLLETDKDNPEISPDGALVSFTASPRGMTELWIASAASPSDAKRIATIEDGELSNYYWSTDSSKILSLVDDRSGRHRLASIDIKSGHGRNLLDTRDRISFLGASATKPNTVAIGLQRADSKGLDAYAADINSGRRTQILREVSVDKFLMDRNLRPVIGISNVSNNVTIVSALRRSGHPRTLFSIAADPYQPSSVLQINGDGQVLYLLDARGRDTTALVAFDIAANKSSILCEDARTDIKRVFFDPSTGRPSMCLAEYGSFLWTALEDAYRGDIDWLNTHMKGYWEPVAAATNGARWIVYSDGVDEPSKYQIYDRETHSLADLFITTPDLIGAPLSKTHAVQISTRDGLMLVAYLTLPKGSDPLGDGRPEHPVPLILMIHGGPWGRAYQRLYSENQFFANRGYAVLAVQFRGSTGFGRRFTKSSYKEWGGSMQNDLLDSIAWAVKAGIAQPGKIAAYGHSYGGYAALLGILKSPEIFACSVDISGPTDLAAFVADAEEGDRAARLEMIGDPANPGDLRMLHERSPLFATENLKRPLLMIQGGKDTTVRRAGSDLMASKLERDGAHFSYVVYPEEGHRISKLEDRESALAWYENFLAGCLGGRAEPMKDFSKLQMQIVYGGSP